MSLKDDRDAILSLLTKALDNCIETAEEHSSEGHTPLSFDATIMFHFEDMEVGARPVLNLTEPLEPQLITESVMVDYQK